MACALCQRDVALMSSHIIPEFVHRRGYDEKHRTLAIGLKLKTKVIQNGFREPLLCEECEGRLQKYEDYFANIWYVRPVIPPIYTSRGFFTLSDVDYAKFKLFVLSLVWRAAVSGLPHFAGMMLGPHEERMRLMILNGEPGPADRYPIMGGLIVDTETGALWEQVLMAPMSIRVDRHNAARMVFGGVSWTVLTSSHGSPTLEPLCLKEDGTIVMAITDWQTHMDVSGAAGVARAVSVPDLR